jgi:cytosine/adenosine deaminase-related metal-dependent hydrolase
MALAIEGGLVVAFDGQQHRLLQDGIVVVKGDKITHVGRDYSSQVDEKIDARHKLVIPGLVNLHCHASTPFTKSLRGDTSSRHFYNSDLFDRFVILPTSQEDDRVAAEFTYAELLRSGCTTVVDLGIGAWPNAQSIDLAQRIGLRCYLLKEYNSGFWRMHEGKLVFDNFDGQKWDEEPGVAELDQAVSFIKMVNGKDEDRLRSFLHPGTELTCSPNLLRETRRVANLLNVRIQIHAAESVLEFHETLRRYRQTPFQVLSSTGLLGNDLIIGHAMYIAGHSKIGYPDTFESEIHLLASSGTSVAHCPVVFSRYGVGLESYFRYLRAGVNVGIGTDSFPQDMFREMNMAATISKIKESEVSVATSRDLFNSATLSGAKALGRNDIGRIAVGAKADITILNLQTLNMSPVRDPIRNLVMCATRNDVDRVLVDGRTILENGVIPDIDEASLAAKMQASAEHCWEEWSKLDPDHRKIEDVAPSSLKPW